jgi:hypothetical protein
MPRKPSTYARMVCSALKTTEKMVRTSIKVVLTCKKLKISSNKILMTLKVVTDTLKEMPPIYVIYSADLISMRLTCSKVLRMILKVKMIFTEVLGSFLNVTFSF